LDGRHRAALERLHQDKCAQGLRSIAVAWHEFPATTQSVGLADEAQLVFAGFCLFLDPPKETAAAAIKRLEGAGIRVKIISGDAAPTVRHLVETLNIPARGLLTGAEIASLSDAALALQAEKTDVFARVSPDQKTRIIRALLAGGHAVGFIGDGINDAPRYMPPMSDSRSRARRKSRARRRHDHARSRSRCRLRRRRRRAPTTQIS
jgi:Mg2+-importing ATPase